MPFDAQIYRLASIARDKLCREASRASHDLRCLVAHANLLDELLIELSAPRGGPAEHYGFGLLPRPVTRATTPRPARPIVVTVMESSEHELEDDGHLDSSERVGGSHSIPSTLPMLYHDPESDSDSSSDSDGNSDDGDDFETAITSNSPPTSPTTSVSTTVEDDVEPNEDELALHRTKSGWRFLGNYPSKERSRRKHVTPVNAITNGVQRVNLSTT